MTDIVNVSVQSPPSIQIYKSPDEVLNRQIGFTRPAARSNGAPLQVGDRWLNFASQVWFFWSGSLWLSEQIFTAIHTSQGVVETAGLGFLGVETGQDVYLLNFSLSCVLFGNQSTQDHWVVRLERCISRTNENVAIGQIVTSDLTLTPNVHNSVTQTVSLGLHQPMALLNSSGFRLACYRINTPNPIFQPSFQLTYRMVA